MSIARKLLGGATAGDTYVDDVFSAYVYDGNNNGQVIPNGIALGDGLRGGLATYFDGTSNIKLNNGVEIVSSSSAYTVSFWIRTDNAETQRPFSLSSGIFYSVERNKVRFYATGSNGSVVGDVIHNCPGITDNLWHHVVHSVTQSSSVMYFDGMWASVVGGSMNGSGSMQGLSSGLALGGQTASQFKGSLANVFINNNYSELTDESTLRLFINADGSPTSSATLEGLAPKVFFPLADLYNAGSVPSSDFTIVGSPRSAEGCDKFITGEGGLVWIKDRASTGKHTLIDTERLKSKVLDSASNVPQETGDPYSITSFNSDGFSVGESVRTNSNDYVSWTWRKSPKFFDIVTYTGSGEQGQIIDHGLGVAPGMVIVKSLTQAANWFVYHRALGDTSTVWLNSTNKASTDSSYLFGSTATDTQFSIPTGSSADAANNEYIAYFFAHDDSDEGLIQCGSYTGTGNSNGPTIDLGWEPQYLLIKKYSADYDNWLIADATRGIPEGGGTSRLYANTSAAEVYYASDSGLDLTATGFRVDVNNSEINQAGESYIYMAIRRPNKPASEGFEADELFAIDQSQSAPYIPGFQSGFPVDMAFYTSPGSSGDRTISSRLTQTRKLATNSINADENKATLMFDYMNGWYADANAALSSWMWRRAPGFFDVVTFKSEGNRTTEYPHNLQVVPEMVWVKCRTLSSADWHVWHKDLTGPGWSLKLNDNLEEQLTDTGSPPATYTDTYFTVGGGVEAGGSNTQDYIAYLWASVPGICDIGSYTGNGTTLDIDCGFTNGVRFILIRRTDVSGNWTFWDTAQGISSGDDPFLALNNTGAQTKNLNCLSPLSSGVTVKHPNVNTDGGTYIYMAIA